MSSLRLQLSLNCAIVHHIILKHSLAAVMFGHMACSVVVPEQQRIIPPVDLVRVNRVGWAATAPDSHRFRTSSAHALSSGSL